MPLTGQDTEEPPSAGERRSSACTKEVAGWDHIHEATCSPMNRFQVSHEWLGAWQGTPGGGSGREHCGFPGMSEATGHQQTPGAHRINLKLKTSPVGSVHVPAYTGTAKQ